MEQLLETILENLKKSPHSYQPYEDLYYMCKEAMKDDVELAVKYLKLLSVECERGIADRSIDGGMVQQLFFLHKRVLLAAAPHDFDSYLLYVEWNREPDKKFYPPRRKVLKQVVDALQELADDKLDLLAISMPPGSGKTTLAIFYLTWLGGRTPNLVRVTASELNIRKGAGTNYGTNGSIKDKGIYTIIAESTGAGATKWGKLKSGAGWISLDYTKRV